MISSIQCAEQYRFHLGAMLPGRWISKSYQFQSVLRPDTYAPPSSKTLIPPNPHPRLAEYFSFVLGSTKYPRYSDSSYLTRPSNLKGSGVCQNVFVNHVFVPLNSLI